jgi:hypothetical protein
MTLPTWMSSSVFDSTTPTRVVVDSTTPLCPPAVVATVLCLEVASRKCVLLLEIDTVAEGKRGIVHEA